MNDKWKFTITLSHKNTNELGEILRNEFFNQDGGDFGCYSTFELRSDVKELPNDVVLFEEGTDLQFKEIWTCAEKVIDEKVVKMAYFWDGDGVLTFEIPIEGGSVVLANTDCKKNYHWTILEERSGWNE